MQLMPLLQSVCWQLEWNLEQRDKLICKARRDGFTRKEIAAVTGLSERQISRIAENDDGSEPSNAYYRPGTDRPHWTPPEER